MSAVGPGQRAAHPRDDEEQDDDEAPPALGLTRRTLLVVVTVLVLVVVLAAVVLPQVEELGTTYDRLRAGDLGWLALGAAFSVLSFAGYVAMLKAIYVRPDDPSARRIGFAESYQITMAGLAATRLLAAGGAGGLAVTAWALRRAGMPARVVADRTVAFLVLTYLVYVAAVVVGGFGLHFGLFPGAAPTALTAVPAAIGVVLLAGAGMLTLTPADIERRFGWWVEGQGRLHRLEARLATVPATASEGVRLAWRHLRSRDPALLATVAYWGFNVVILWACFHAFGVPPPAAVLVVAYFVGLLGNLLPLPGGIGGGGQRHDRHACRLRRRRLARRRRGALLPGAGLRPADPAGRRGLPPGAAPVCRWGDERAAEHATIQNEVSPQNPTGSSA